MEFKKKKLIVVDGKEYHWQVRRVINALHIRILDKDKVYLEASSPMKNSITPKIISEMIKERKIENKMLMRKRNLKLL